MKNTLVLFSLLSVSLATAMEQPAISAPQQAPDQMLEISSKITGESRGSEDHYQVDAMLTQNSTQFARIRYFLYTLPAIVENKTEYFRATINDITLTNDGFFYERCRNDSPNLSRILAAYAIKDLIHLHGKQIRPEFAAHQPLHIKSQYSSASNLLLKEFGFEIICDNNLKPSFYKLSIPLGSESPILALCDKHLAEIQTPLTSIEAVPARDSSTSSEEKLPLKPAAVPPVIPQEELRKTALAKLRTRQNGKAKLPRSELESMLAKPGYWLIRGISKKTSSKNP